MLKKLLVLSVLLMFTHRAEAMPSLKFLGEWDFSSWTNIKAHYFKAPSIPVGTLLTVVGVGYWLHKRKKAKALAQESSFQDQENFSNACGQDFDGENEGNEDQNGSDSTE